MATETTSIYMVTPNTGYRNIAARALRHSMLPHCSGKVHDWPTHLLSIGRSLIDAILGSEDKNYPLDLSSRSFRDFRPGTPNQHRRAAVNG